MIVLVLGATGMLGRDVVATLTDLGHNVLAPTRAELDLTGDFTLPACDRAINCAAYTAVDLAETEPEKARALNANVPARLAKRLGDRLIHVSTDFVFDGSARTPYRPGDPTGPLQVYGQTKLDGESPVLENGGTVVRTSWLFGEHGRCFPRTILNAARAGKPLRVVNDQIGTPTATADLAIALASIVEAGPIGLLHCGGPEVMSWADLAERTLKAAGLDVPIAPVPSTEYPTPARRPAYSALAPGPVALPTIDASLAKAVAIWLRATSP